MKKFRIALLTLGTYSPRILLSFLQVLLCSEPLGIICKEIEQQNDGSLKCVRNCVVVDVPVGTPHTAIRSVFGGQMLMAVSEFHQIRLTKEF